MAASVLVWVATMAIGGRQPGPQQVSASAEQMAQKEAIDDGLRAVDASLAGPLGAVASVSVIVDRSHALDRVIALGTPALPELISRIDNSSENGLHEAILAICASRIIKADVGGPPDTGLCWSTGKEFPAVWKTYLARIPAAVAAITASDIQSDEKNIQLVKLGTPAIPFILDEVERGHSELSSAAEALMRGTVEMDGASAKGLATAAWARQNKERFAGLRSLVSEAK